MENRNDIPLLLKLNVLPTDSSPIDMDDNLPNVREMVNDTRSQEPDSVVHLISSFLIARSRIFRQLSELREEVSEPSIQTYPQITLIYYWKRRLIAFARDGVTPKATSTLKSSGKPRMKRLSGNEDSSII